MSQLWKGGLHCTLVCDKYLQRGPRWRSTLIVFSKQMTIRWFSNSLADKMLCSCVMILLRSLQSHRSLSLALCPWLRLCDACTLSYYSTHKFIYHYLCTQSNNDRAVRCFPSGQWSHDQWDSIVRTKRSGMTTQGTYLFAEIRKPAVPTSHAPQDSIVCMAWKARCANFMFT
jgi:hypothetical protein